MSRRPGAPHAPSHTRPLASLALRKIALVGALGSLAFDGQFRGCGTESTPPATPLPEGDPLECLVDSDCTASMCNAPSCVAGVCRETPLLIDDDRDGDTAAPCGMDCDDSDPNTSSRMLESCDGRDNDCDASVDEDTSPTPIVYEVGAQVRASGAIGDLPGVVLLSFDAAGAGSYELVARWYDLASSAPFDSAPIATFTDTSGLVETVASTEGLRVFWTSVADRALRQATVSVTRTDTEATVTVGPTTDLLTDVDVVALRATESASGHALLVETIDETTGVASRRLLVAGAAPASLPFAETGFDLASRDVRFYTPAAEQEIAVVNESGAELARLILPGVRLGDDPLVSWNGRVFISAGDIGTAALYEITPADGVGDSYFLASSGSYDIRLHPLSTTLAATSVASGVDLSVFDATLMRTEIYPGLVYSGTGLYPYRGVHESGVGLVAVVTRGNASEGSAVVHILCR